MRTTSLGYLRVESPNTEEWASFGPQILGLAITDDGRDPPGAVSLTNDDRPGRLVVSKGDRNRVECIGWELSNADAFAEAAEELRAAGVEFTKGTEGETDRARVRGILRFKDPAGFEHELFWGQLMVPNSFRPGRPNPGFVTGSQGLGHVALVVPDLEDALRFYCNVMGFRISDEILLGEARIIFLHANPRHHSLAVTAIPGLRGLHHLMLEVDRLDEVGVAYDLCAERDVPISLTMGRHTNDRMCSFYMRTPGGFDIEYGWGGQAVDDEQWTVTHMISMSIWGHRPGDAGMLDCLESTS